MATYGFSDKGLSTINGRPTGVDEKTVAIVEAGAAKLVDNPNYKAEVSAPSPALNNTLSPT